MAVIKVMKDWDIRNVDTRTALIANFAYQGKNRSHINAGVFREHSQDAGSMQWVKLQPYAVGQGQAVVLLPNSSNGIIPKFWKHPKFFFFQYS